MELVGQAGEGGEADAAALLAGGEGTRRWRAGCTSAEWARSRSCTACCARRRCSPWWRCFFVLSFPHADFGTALVLLPVASVSFVGVGMVTAVLPLISPEKGAQLGFIAQGFLLVISGVYYPVSVLPGWTQWLSTVSPATYALEGIRAAVLEGAGLGAVWGDLWPLLALGAVSISIGLAVIRAAERYAKRHGGLKRSG